MNKKIVLFVALTLCVTTTSFAMQQNGKKRLEKSLSLNEKIRQGSQKSFAASVGSKNNKKVPKQTVHSKNLSYIYVKKKNPGCKRRRKPSQKNRQEQ